MTLAAGDRVAVLALSSAPPPERLEPGLAVLREWGLEIVEGESLRGPESTPTGEAVADAERASEFRAAWCDPSIAAIWCARGGYGMQRMLAALGEGFWQEPPNTTQGRAKMVIGFSDVTPLLHRVSRAGGQALHGPTITGLGSVDPAGTESVRRLAFGEVDPGDALLTGLRAWDDDPSGVTGRLVGGNIALLAQSIGCGDLLDAQGAIVFLEDIGQPSWVIDRHLTQLIRSGWLGAAAGLVLGDIGVTDDADMPAVTRDRLAGLGVPVWSGGSFGHVEPNLALPIGASVTAGAGRLLFTGR